MTVPVEIGTPARATSAGSELGVTSAESNLGVTSAGSELGATAGVGERSLEMIRRMVAFETVSRDSNVALIEWVRDWLERHGAIVRITWNDERSKANLFGTLPAGDGNVVRAASCFPGTPTWSRSTDNPGRRRRSKRRRSIIGSTGAAAPT